MLLRGWKYDDIITIAELEKKCFSDPWNFKMLADSFLNAYFRGIVCEEDGVIVGYAGYMYSDDAELLLIAVDGGYRRRGCARAMLESMCADCKSKSVGRVFLEVRVSNSAAIALYTQFGFVKIGERKGYYGNGEDAAIMVKAV